MVKKIIKISVLGFILAALCLIIGCNNDLLGFFWSNDLDERLKERDNLKFLVDRDWDSLTLGDSYSFIVIADTHIEGTKTFGLEKMKDVVAANTDIEFAVILGDITQQGAAKEVDTFINFADTLGVPCYPVVGNHDFYFNNWKDVWKKKIGSTSYRIDSDSTTLFMLDSANSFFGKDQLDWLEREIKTAKKRTFVFTHSPLFAEGPFDMQQIISTKERARIVNILRNKCDIMFMGHVHSRIENKVENVRYAAIDAFIETKIYVIVTVEPNKVSYKFETLR